MTSAKNTMNMNSQEFQFRTHPWKIPQFYWNEHLFNLKGAEIKTAA